MRIKLISIASILVAFSVLLSVPCYGVAILVHQYPVRTNIADSDYFLIDTLTNYQSVKWSEIRAYTDRATNYLSTNINLRIAVATNGVYTASTNYATQATNDVLAIATARITAATNNIAIPYTNAPQFSTISLTNTATGALDFTNALGIRIRFTVSDSQATLTNMVFPDVMTGQQQTNVAVVSSGTNTTVTSSSANGITVFRVHTLSEDPIIFDLDLDFTSTNATEYAVYTNIVSASNSLFLTDYVVGVGPTNFFSKHSDHFFYYPTTLMHHVGSNILSTSTSQSSISARWDTNADVGMAVLFLKGATNEQMNWTVKVSTNMVPNGEVPGAHAPFITLVNAVILSETEVAIYWATDISTTNNVVDYGFNSSFGNVVLDNTSDVVHSNYISGLAAGTSYRFRVRSSETTMGLSATNSEGGFTTAGSQPSTLLQDLAFVYKLNEAGTSAKLDTTGGTPLGVTNTLYSTNGVVGMATEGRVSGYAQNDSESKFQFGNTDWTLAFWAKLNSLSVIQCLMSKFQTGKGEFDSVYINGSGIQLSVFTNYTTPHNIFYMSPPANTWLYFNLKYLSSQNKLIFQRGNQTNLFTAVTNVLNSPPVIPTNSPFSIFARNGGGYRMNGSLDDVTKWGRCLTSTETTNHWMAGTNATTYPYSGF